ncbi:MAG: hypothetical protein IH830_12320 [Planctomycetes bacterium]|nr:hypothetical protein [Planctomycetota bacterium]
MRRNYLGLMLLVMASLAIGPIAVLAGGQGGAAGVTPAGTVFTYQGQLDQGGVRVNSTCDFEFSLWDAAVGPTQIGGTLFVINVTVTDGRFTVQLDFGAAAFNGNARWLEIAVRCPSGAGLFTTLVPRQPLTPAPYAVRSLAPWAVSPTNKSDIIYETGNVGIGTASPQARFHLDAGSVFGQTPFQVVGEDFNTGLIARFRRSNPLEPSITMLTLGNTEAILASEKSWRFDTDAAGNSPGTPRMTILHGSGNVGIGTTAPTEKLDVAGSVRITDGTQGEGKVLTSDASGVGTWQTPAGGGGFSNMQVFSSPVMSDFTVPAGVTKLMIEVRGGGGGGGKGNAGGGAVGQGGSGSGYGMGIFSVTPGSIHAVTVGAGGLGSNGGTCTVGAPGGTTSFGIIISATGGGGGGGCGSSSTPGSSTAPLNMTGEKGRQYFSSPATPENPGGACGDGSTIGRGGNGNEFFGRDGNDGNVVVFW